MKRIDPTTTGAGHPAAVVAARLDALDDAVDRLNDVTVDALAGDMLTEIARRLRRVQGRLDGLQARTVTAAETSGAARDAGAVGGAQWLSAVTGATPHAARRSETLGKAMDAVPQLAEAVTSGAMDGEQATTLASATERGSLTPDDVADLVDEARHTPAGALSRETKRREGRANQRRLKRDEQAARDLRRFDIRPVEHGMVEGSFRLPALEGNIVATAVGSLATPDPADAPDELRRTPTQRRADALVDLARRTLEAGDAGTVRTVKPHVHVVVPAAMLAATDEAAEAAGSIGTLDDGTVLSAQTTRKVLCDATVRRIVLDPDGRPLDVGRATRTWSGAQRAASRAVDGGCRGPACDRLFDWTDLHHVTWWRHGGRTSLDDGVPLCSHCHDLVHHHQWTIQLDSASRICTWTAPDGRRITTHPYGPAAPARQP